MKLRLKYEKAFNGYSIQRKGLLLWYPIQVALSYNEALKLLPKLQEVYGETK